MEYQDLPFLRSPRRHLICVPATLLVSFAIFGAEQARAQNVAEAARQERAKKDSQQKKSKHVYTNEDLKRPVILMPEDRELLEASKNRNGVLAEEAAKAWANYVDAQSTPGEISLGEVARENRKRKFLEELARGEQLAPFHLPLASEALAALKPPVFPAVKTPSNSLVIIRPPQRPAVEFQPFAHPRKRSPFERSIVPASPAMRPSLKAPAIPAFHSNLQPVAPSVGTVIPAPAAKAVPAPAVKMAPAPTPKVVPGPAAKTIPSPSTNSVLAPAVIASEPKVSTPANRFVVVQVGDSLWKLAEQNLGRGARWHEFVAANPNIVDPTRIAVGSRIMVPSNSSVVRHAAAATAKIKVQKGDTLWTLAEAHFGQASLWTCIAKANPTVYDPNRIFVGQELVLPTGCSTPSR
jgi:LysM repeat protein